MTVAEVWNLQGPDIECLLCTQCYSESAIINASGDFHNATDDVNPAPTPFCSHMILQLAGHLCSAANQYYLSISALSAAPVTLTVSAMASARPPARYLLISWGRRKTDRSDPLCYFRTLQNWVDAEQLKQDPGVNLGKRNTSLRGWMDKCMIDVFAS